MLNNLEDIICVLICIPHIEPIDKDLALKHVKDILMLICSSLTQVSNSENNESVKTGIIGAEGKGTIEKLLFTLTIGIETLIHLSEGRNVSELFRLDTLTDAVLSYTTVPNYVNSLRALDLYLTACSLKNEDEAYLKDLLKTLHSAMLRNLCSPFHD
ncbi:hypothetical protein L9F63_025375, partial [Diploptera punctata]